MKQLSMIVAIAGCITLTTFGSEWQKQWQKQQEQQRQQAITQVELAQRINAPISYSTMSSLDPYNQRQAQAYNNAVAAQQAAFVAKATGQKR